MGGAGGSSGGSGGAACIGGGAVIAPSCQGLADSCGPGGDEDCCDSPFVQGGTYYRSYDGVTHSDDSNPATVSCFRLDRFAVTVGRFRAFVQAGLGTQESPPDAGDGAHPLIAASGWQSSWNGELPLDQAGLISNLKCYADFQTWTDAAGDNEAHPINCVSWYEAFAFCAWDGGRLPTEAEWNYAAAGGDEQREYPWGSGIDPSYAVYNCTGNGDPKPNCVFEDILSVGSRSPKGDGRWGQADLAGSMGEWNLDWHADYVNPCHDCANLAQATYRVRRSGSWIKDAEYLRAANRDSYTPAEHRNYIGLRCARTPDP